MTRGGTRTSRGARLLTLSRYAGVPVYSREVEGQGEGLPRAPRRAFTRRPSPLPLPAYRERGKCTARRFLLALVIVVVVGSMQSRALALALTGWLYAQGLFRLWRASGVGHGVKRWEAACYALGWLALVVALVSPL